MQTLFIILLFTTNGMYLLARPSEIDRRNQVEDDRYDRLVREILMDREVEDGGEGRMNETETIEEFSNSTQSEPTATNSSRTERESGEKKPAFFDFRTLIKRRENDWRDAWDGPQIIWSHESVNHPDYGRGATGIMKNGERQNRSSQFASFAILGSVIGFILYTYCSHVILMRKLRKEEEKKQLQHLIQRSALIMASSAQAQGTEALQDNFGRKRSLINMFQKFRL